MKLRPSAIKFYVRRWAKIAASQPTLHPKKVERALGKKIVINSMGGGCWCLLNFGRCASLARAGLPVEHFYGCSAGSLAGLAFLDPDFFEEMMVQFGHLANDNLRNLYPRNLLRLRSPFPHRGIIQGAFNRAWAKRKQREPGRTQLTTVLTRHWSQWTPVGYLLALIVFGIQVGLARRLPLLGRPPVAFFNEGGRGYHLDWARRLGLFPSPHTLHGKSRLEDILEFALASMSLWPFLPFYKKERDNFTDGSLLVHNALPVIVENHKDIDTLVTLPTEPVDAYGEEFLGLAGYRKKEQRSPCLVVCTEPRDPALPRQHVLWNRPAKARLRFFDYTNAHAALEEFSEGYRASAHFMEALDLV